MVEELTGILVPAQVDTVPSRTPALAPNMGPPATNAGLAPVPKQEPETEAVAAPERTYDFTHIVYSHRLWIPRLYDVPQLEVPTYPEEIYKALADWHSQCDRLKIETANDD